jgi:hypothetical protein
VFWEVICGPKLEIAKCNLQPPKVFQVIRYTAAEYLSSNPNRTSVVTLEYFTNTTIKVFIKYTLKRL